MSRLYLTLDSPLFLRNRIAREHKETMKDLGTKTGIVWKRYNLGIHLKSVNASEPGQRATSPVFSVFPDARKEGNIIQRD